MGEIPSRLTKQHINTVLYRAMFHYLRKHYPELDLKSLCENIGLSLDYMEQEQNWVSIVPAAAFTEEIVKRTNNPSIWFDAGKQPLAKEVVGNLNYHLMRDFLSTRTLYSQLPAFTNQYSRVIRLTPIHETPGFLELRVQPITDGMNEEEKRALAKNFPTIIENAIAYYITLPTYHGLPPASVTPEKTGLLVDQIPEYRFLIRYHNRGSSILPYFLTCALPALGLLAFGYLIGLSNGLISLSAALLFLASNALYFLHRTRKLSNSFQQAAMALQELDRRYLELQRSHERNEALSSAYQKFVPFEFLKLLGVDDITKMNTGLALETKLTVLFFDLRGFTTMSEGAEPERVFSLLNHLLEVIGPLFRKHNGFIDKFIGDGLMAIFPRASDDAFTCAIEIQKELNARVFAEFNQRLRAAIGISTGPMLLGVMGFEAQSQCTPIADAVNVASRLESLSKQLDLPILVSQDALDACLQPDQFRFESLGEHQLKGRSQSVSVFALHSLTTLLPLTRGQISNRR